ncbi:phosphonate metabolism transcriptional regulator PhnF [Nitratidesulfovibrio sp.]|uniref:phosphonate metabolism transcriptional regulator PhnF n=1 Tax=Nitratidesulfovibrio sp. TaxID=2802297 RepID=UPI00334192CB
MAARAARAARASGTARLATAGVPAAQRDAGSHAPRNPQLVPPSTPPVVSPPVSPAFPLSDDGARQTLWSRVHDVLRREIEAKCWAPGCRLPTEKDLCVRFAVNRHTVRRALRGLEEAGLIRRRQGLGTFVRERVLEYQVARRTRFSANMDLNLARSRSHYLYGDELPAGELVALRLGVPAGSRVVYLETWGEAEGKPLYISSQYLPYPRFEGVARVFERTGSLTASYRTFGVNDFFRRESRITTRLPEPEEARVLGLEDRHPLLVVEYVNVDADGRAIEYGITRFCGDRLQLLVPGA